MVRMQKLYEEYTSINIITYFDQEERRDRDRNNKPPRAMRKAVLFAQSIFLLYYCAVCASFTTFTRASYLLPSFEEFEEQERMRDRLIPVAESREIPQALFVADPSGPETPTAYALDPVEAQRRTKPSAPRDNLDRNWDQDEVPKQKQLARVGATLVALLVVAASISPAFLHHGHSSSRGPRFKHSTHAVKPVHQITKKR